MQVICLLSRKGGSGKSTLAMHWAVEAERQGIGKVVLIDMDAQGSCASWFAKREVETPILIRSEPKSLAGHLSVCESAGVDLVVIDTVPDIDTSAVVAARLSDLVVIPTRPSVLDLESIAGSVEIVTGLKRQAVIVINQAPPTSSVTEEARQAMEGYGLPICPIVIVSRLTFSRALIDGRVAQEIEPRGKAASEITQSWQWVNANYQSIPKIQPTR
jgi:chromosome partitioning protein